MSEKEREMLNKIAKLPVPLQEKFLDRVEGAAIAVETLAAAAADQAGRSENNGDSVALPASDAGRDRGPAL